MRSGEQTAIAVSREAKVKLCVEFSFEGLHGEQGRWGAGRQSADTSGVQPFTAIEVMTVTYLGKAEADTILSGVGSLVQAGEWPIAIVVFTASIMVPIVKIVLLGWIYFATWLGLSGPLRQRTRVYRITELIGRWSMIDVFMVSILAALVKLGNIASIQPGFGAVAFCGVVILTMLSAMAFDPRLIWDRAGQRKNIIGTHDKHANTVNNTRQTETQGSPS